MKRPLLTFENMGTQDKAVFYVYNHENIYLGSIEKQRVGQFLHWTFTPDNDTFYTNGCLKEIVMFITSLYNNDKKSNDKGVQDK